MVGAVVDNGGSFRWWLMVVVVETVMVMVKETSLLIGLPSRASIVPEAPRPVNPKAVRMLLVLLKNIIT